MAVFKEWTLYFSGEGIVGYTEVLYKVRIAINILLLCISLSNCSGSSSLDGSTDILNDSEISIDDTSTVDIVDSSESLTDTTSECERLIDEIEATATIAGLEYDEDPTFPYWVVKSALSGNLDETPVTYMQLWSATASDCRPCGVVIPGDYSLADWPPNSPEPGIGSCGLCVTYFESCNSTQTHNTCAKKFMAIDGFLELLEYDEWPGRVIRARLTGMYLVEWNNYPIEGGAAICVDLWEIDEPLLEL
jgi:hypothetical protein